MPITDLRKFANRGNTKPLNFGSAVVAGANANTNIAVAGLKTTDKIVSVTEYAGPGEAAGQPAATDRTAQASIPSNGNLRVSVATNTSADRRLHVQWISV